MKGSGGRASSGQKRGAKDPGPSSPGDKARQTSHPLDSIRYNTAHAKSHEEEAAKATNADSKKYNAVHAKGHRDEAAKASKMLGAALKKVPANVTAVKAETARLERLKSAAPGDARVTRRTGRRG